MVELVAMEFAVLKENFVIMACVLAAIQCATLMKNAVTEHALDGNVAIVQMHVHNSKHAPMVFVADLKKVQVAELFVAKAMSYVAETFVV